MALMLVSDGKGATMGKNQTKTAQLRPSLGGKYLLATPMALVGLLREGVPWTIYRGVVTDLGLNDQTAAGVLHIPARTLARRKGGRLEPQESERFMRLVRLVSQATDVLGTREKALRWLEAPNRALEGSTPMSLLDTDVGTQAAEAVLTRIEYGVFS
jgi:putative toxin-antitoxin system antitoxin component (TIGR02293 family)